MFHSQLFDCTGVSCDSSSQQVGFEDSSEKFDHEGAEVQISSVIEPFSSDIGFFRAQNELRPDMTQHLVYQQQHFKEFGNIDDLYLNVVSPPLQSCEIKKIIGNEANSSEQIELKKRKSRLSPFESFEILRKYKSRCLKLDHKCNEMQSTNAHAGGAIFPTETSIKWAAENFIHSMSKSSNEVSTLNHPYPSLILAHSEEDSNGVQLVQNLLCCAEEVSENQYERAIKFLNECDRMSSRTGTPIQRLVFYFSEAIFEKIAVETGRKLPKDSDKQPVDSLTLNMFPNMTLNIAFHKEYPLAQITKLVGIQGVLHHLKDARKVHMIDLEIRTGVHWIILMQALAAKSEHPLEHLKITAMATKWKSMMEAIGRQLESFAQSLNLKFTFKTVLVEDILDLNHNLFDLDADESVAVYASYTLTNMVGRADRLDHLMKVIRNMSPCVMIVSEHEVNCNSPTFIGRFVESLFYFGAIFDSLADCFKNDETSRTNAESTWFSSSIRNVLAAEGDDRKIRHVSINVWRAFFARFGLVEIELSMPAIDQASLGLRNYPCGSSCTLHTDGKCLTLGWKGTPLSSVSAWKFR